MKITWSSRKGQTRRLNNDAAALAYVGDYLIAVVVDAAEKTRGMLFGISPEGKRLAAWWADTCAHTLAKTPEALTSKPEVVVLLAGMQKSLRTCFLHDIASYGVLILHRRSGEANWLYTGDCRLGIESAAGELNWLGTPHRVDSFSELNTACSNPSPELELAARHTLTRSLNAKRFSQPEWITTRLDNNSTEPMKLLVATDGYWCEVLQSSMVLPYVNDDASLLTIAYGPQSLTLDTDAPNLFVTCHN